MHSSQSRLLAAVSILVIGVAFVTGHSESHIHDPHIDHNADFEAAAHRKAHSLSNDHIEEQFKFCNVCRTALVPVVRDAIVTSAGDADAKEVIEAAMSTLAHTHFYSAEHKATVRRDEPGELDEEVHEYVQNLLWDVSTSRGLYALVDVWHHFPKQRRTHFDFVIEHVMCVCHHDRLMAEPNDRLHKYLLDFEAALQGALKKYGGHPSLDPKLRHDEQAEHHPFAADDNIPHVHETKAGVKYTLSPGDIVLPHEHPPSGNLGEF